MKYEALGHEQRTAMADNRIAQLEQEHYSHKLRLAELATFSDDDVTKAKAIEDSEKAMAAIERQRDAVLAERAAIQPDASTS